MMTFSRAALIGLPCVALARIEPTPARPVAVHMAAIVMAMFWEMSKQNGTMDVEAPTVKVNPEKSPALMDDLFSSS